MMLSEFIAKERKQSINREWEYLTPLQRSVVFARFAIGILPRRALRAFYRYLEYKRAMFAYSYPAHWV